MLSNNKANYVYFRDAFIYESEATISATSTLAQYGLNVFEGIRGYFNEGDNNLYLFRLYSHINRLFNSSKILRFELDNSITAESIEKKVIEIIKMNDFREDIYIRISLFIDNDDGWGSSSPISLLITAFPKGRSFVDKAGLSCCVSSWRRINDTSFPPRIKTGTNYLNSRLAQLEASINGYDYCILLNDRSTVSEGPGSCLFIVRDGELITPPLYASILESITREVILDVAKKKLNMKISEREIDRTELYLADEVFMAGTTVEIMPVLKIDQVLINNAQLGRITKIITSNYIDIVTGRHNEYRIWLTPVY